MRGHETISEKIMFYFVFQEIPQPLNLQTAVFFLFELKALCYYLLEYDYDYVIGFE